MLIMAKYMFSVATVRKYLEIQGKVREFCGRSGNVFYFEMFNFPKMTKGFFFTNQGKSENFNFGVQSSP